MEDKLKRIQKYVIEGLSLIAYNYGSIEEAQKEEPLFVILMCINNILKED